jgi:3-oxoacyl-[acyl-carrier protein] reductase
MDEAFSARTSAQKRVVHGMLTASFISTVIGTKLPGAGALWYEQKLQFLSAVRIGESVRVRCTVKGKSLSTRVLTLETLVFAESGRMVIQGEAKVRVLEIRSEESKSVKTKKGAVLVTGASGGIGEATARALARDGFPVLVHFHQNRSEAERVMESIRSDGGEAGLAQADVRSPEQVELMVRSALETFGGLEGVVNNASPKIFDKEFSRLSWADLQDLLDVNLKGAFLTTQAILPHLMAQSSGSIVNIGSIYADNVPPGKILPYVVSKAALASMTRCLAVELGPHHIRVNCVAPGMTQTSMIADVPEKSKLLAKMQTPLRSLAGPEDVAGAVSFLFSEKAGHITGETLRVCGGVTML